MRSKNPYTKVFLLTLLICSCTSESEQILNEKIKNRYYDFSKLHMDSDSISWNIEEGIQYGLIHLENGEKVKFWFISHHLTKDNGGTIYEYPNGEKQFCSGFHCCQIQFYDNRKSGKIFKNTADLKAYVTKNDGIRP